MSSLGHTGRWCFRCGAELPGSAGETLWCSACGAAQLRLAESVQAHGPDQEPHTTGAVPPPVPHLVDWRGVVQAAALVGAAGALVVSAGLAVDALSPLGTLWLLFSGVLGTTLYRLLRPRIRMDARVGVRVGLVSGLFTLAAVGVALTVSALVARFALHRGAEMDEAVTHLLGSFVAQVQSQPGGPLLSPGAVGILESPEGRAGYMLLMIAVDSLFAVALAAGGGAVAGTLSRRRSRMGRAL